MRAFTPAVRLAARYLRATAADLDFDEYQGPATLWRSTR